VKDHHTAGNTGKKHRRNTDLQDTQTQDKKTPNTNLKQGENATILKKKNNLRRKRRDHESV
jgi:hypothetical protein